jgi:hypothetical protein
MKHCPACNFSFPDFHLVCDFDGTPLVSDPPRVALIKLTPQKSPRRRFIVTSKLLTVLAILALFLTAAFIAYQQTTSRSARTLLATNVAIPPLETPASSKREFSAPRSVSTPRSRTPEKAAKRARRSWPVAPSVARNPKTKANEHSSGQPEDARRASESPTERQPKFVSVLKTTWRVLKRPFSF